ncbi:unnamed protein product [Gadus morhua 'NCC']
MTLEVIFIQEELAGLGSAVIKVDPRIRNHIIKNKRKDFLDMSAVHAIDQIHLTQCFACQKFGHKRGSQFCQFHGQEKTVCLYSAKEHESKNCSVKRDPQKHNCSNCLNSTNNRLKKTAAGHTSTSPDCPIHQRETQSVEATKLVQPVLLGYLLHYFETYDPNDYHGLQLAFCYAFGISLCSLLLAVMHHLYFHYQKVGMKIRVALCHMIYKKALCLSNSATGKTTTGQIVNLLSNDVGKFDELTLWLQALWVAPIQVAVVVALLWAEIGPSCLAGILVPIILMPLQTLFGRLFSMFRSRMAVLTDSRIRTMNEVVCGMRIIKMYAWEKPFASLVSRFRGEEINNVMKSSMLQALNLASFFSASKVIIFITFAIYVQLGNTITASSVFVTVSLYSNTATTVNLFFPRAIELLFESYVSVQRIQPGIVSRRSPAAGTPPPRSNTAAGHHRCGAPPPPPCSGAQAGG